MTENQKTAHNTDFSSSKLDPNPPLRFIFFIALTVIVSAAYSVYRHYDFSYSIDADSYLRMAQGDFYHTSITHRYRFIVPLLAGGLTLPFRYVFAVVFPDRAADTENLIRFCFFIINSLLMAGFGTLLFRIARSAGVAVWAAVLAMIFALTTRWGIDGAGVPLVESLYLLVVAMFTLGLLTGDRRLQIAAIFIGPFAKEAFVFFVPILLFYTNINKISVVKYLIISGLLVFASRYLISTATVVMTDEEGWNFLRHLYNIATNLRIALTPKGILETFSAVGLGGALLVYALTRKALRQSVFGGVPAILWVVLAACVLQGLLGEWGRMLYYASPLWVVLIGRAAEKIFISSKR